MNKLEYKRINEVIDTFINHKANTWGDKETLLEYNTPCLIKLFKENYIVIDSENNQAVNKSRGYRNEDIEEEIFKRLCSKISNPIRNIIDYELGTVCFINDQDENTIMFKFTGVNHIFSTGQKLENIVNEINNLPRIAFA